MFFKGTHVLVPSLYSLEAFSQSKILLDLIQVCERDIELVAIGIFYDKMFSVIFLYFYFFDADILTYAVFQWTT